MNKLKAITVAAACAVPLLAIAPAAQAATAHNIQSGQNNKNVDSSGTPGAQPMAQPTTPMKHMKKKHVKKM